MSEFKPLIAVPAFFILSFESVVFAYCYKDLVRVMFGCYSQNRAFCEAVANESRTRLEQNPYKIASITSNGPSDSQTPRLIFNSIH